MQRVLLFLCLVFYGSLSAYAEGVDPAYSFSRQCDQIRFKGLKKLIIVEATVNDKKGWFVLDTGMKDLLLNSNYFRGLPPKEVPDSISLVDVKGQVQPTKAVKVDQFSWGEIHRKDFLARATNIRTMEKVLKMRILGLIGMEVVRHLELVVDYGQQILTIRQPDMTGPCRMCPDAPDYELTFAYQNHLPALKARLGNKSELWLGMDTGSSLSMIDEQLQRGLRRKTHTLTKVRYGSPNGVYEIPLANIIELNIGQGLEFTYWRFGFNNLEHFQKSGMHIDGLIGGDLFRLGVVSINFSTQKVRIWLRENTFLMRYPGLLAKAKENPLSLETMSCVGD